MILRHVKEEAEIGYREEKKEEKKEDYDIMTVVMVFLGSPERGNYAGVLKLLDVLLSTETNPQEKKQILEEDFQIQMTQKLESEVSVMCNLSKGVEEKGMAKGIKEGVKNSIINLMKNMELSLQDAMIALDIPEAEQAEYIEMIKKD